MVSANVLRYEDMLSSLMTLNPMVSVDTMVMYKYLVTKYLIMLIQVRKSPPRTLPGPLPDRGVVRMIHLRGGPITIFKESRF